MLFKWQKEHHVAAYYAADREEEMFVVAGSLNKVNRHQIYYHGICSLKMIMLTRVLSLDLHATVGSHCVP